MQVTHTLPEESYKAYLRFGAVCRYIGQHRDKISTDNAENMLIVGMLEISEDSIEALMTNPSGLGELLLEALTNPVDPEVFLVTTFFRVRDMSKRKHTDADFVQIMQVLLSIIAVSYNKPKKQVVHDMIAEFKKFDEKWEEFQRRKILDLVAATSPSKELH